MTMTTTDRTCLCGCGESLEGKRAGARYLNDSHAERSRRRRRDPKVGSQERKESQHEGLYQSGKNGLRDAVRRDLARRELLPAAFRGPTDTAAMDFDAKGQRFGGWRAAPGESAQDQTEQDAGKHPRGRLREKQKARKKLARHSQPPSKGGRFGPTGALSDHRDSPIYKILGADRYREMEYRLNLMQEVVMRGPLGRLARVVGMEDDLGNVARTSEPLFLHAVRPVVRRYLSARATLNPTEQLVGELKMSPAVATDRQIAQTVQTLEACRDVISDCVELIRSRFPDDKELQLAVEQLTEHRN